MKCCVIHFYYLHTILYTLATPLWPPAPLRQLGVEVRLLKGSDSGGSGTSWSEASSPLCYHQPHIKWQKTCEGWKENQILTTARRRIQRICRVGVSIHSRRLALEEGDVALGEMTAVIWISIAAAHVATRCLVEQQKYSTRWHTHLLPSTQGPEKKKKKKNHEHSRVSNSYKEENGVRAFEDDLSCSLSIKLHFLCLFISSFFFSDSNTS